MRTVTLKRAKSIISTAVQQYALSVDDDANYVDEVIASEKLLFESLISQSDIECLAHALTVVECEQRGLFNIEVIEDNGMTKYTNQAQEVYDRYYELITNTLGA